METYEWIVIALIVFGVGYYWFYVHKKASKGEKQPEKDKD